MEVVAEVERYGGWDRHASCHSQFISHGERDALAMPVASEISALLPRIRLTNIISYGWYLSLWQRLMDGAAVLWRALEEEGEKGKLKIGSHTSNTYSNKSLFGALGVSCMSFLGVVTSL